MVEHLRNTVSNNYNSLQQFLTSGWYKIDIDEQLTRALRVAHFSHVVEKLLNYFVEQILTYL